MNRRDLFKTAGMAAVVAPLLSVRQIVDLTKPSPKVLPKVGHGEVLTAKAFGDLIDAVNELRADT